MAVLYQRIAGDTDVVFVVISRRPFRWNCSNGRASLAVGTRRNEVHYRSDFNPHHHPNRRKVKGMRFIVK